MKAKRPKAGTSKAEAAKRRALFVEAYVANGGNATDAAIKAGYSKKTAYSAGGRLLKDVEISAEVEKRRAQSIEKAEKATDLTVENILRELGRIALADPRKLFDEHGAVLPVHEWPDDVAAMVAQVEVYEEKVEGAKVGETQKVKLWDKNSALDKAMKHLGLYERDNEQKPVTTILAPGARNIKFEPFKGRSRTAKA
jgi:phage terminase small subunit